MRIGRKGLMKDHTHHFPMAAGCVLPGGLHGHLSVSGSRPVCRRHTPYRDDVRKAHLPEMGEPQPSNRLCQVPQRTGAGVPKIGSIGKLTDPYTVEHQNQHPGSPKTAGGLSHKHPSTFPGSNAYRSAL